MQDSLLIYPLRNNELSLENSYYNPFPKIPSSNEALPPFDFKELDKLVYFAIINNHTLLLKYLVKKLMHAANEQSNEHNTPSQLTQWDVNAIKDFFNNKKRVKEQLKKLNQQLETLARKYGMYDEESHSLKGFNFAWPYKNNKLMSGYFKQWAQENGFSLVFKNDGSHALYKMDAFLSAEEFQAVIREGHLFKDKAQGGKQHGEWTHFIQWWCLVEANKESPFLLVKPHKLFRLLGDYDSTIWFDLFEIPLNEISYRADYNDVSPFTNVINFNQYLLSIECAIKTPILHATIKGRANKRTFEKAKALFFNSRQDFGNSEADKKSDPNKIINFIINKAR